jgi:hypothetical protein
LGVAKPTERVNPYTSCRITKSILQHNKVSPGHIEDGIRFEATEYEIVASSEHQFFKTCSHKMLLPDWKKWFAKIIYIDE